ncbi:MAG: HDOD domain-containing protein [Nitrospinaceae bacterium]
MKTDAESLLKKAVKISSLPTVFNQINEAIEDPECSFLEIARLIGGDAVLSARLLRLANSSFFGFPSPIETITHAITVIGMAPLRDLVLATTVICQFRGMPQNGIDMNAFWRHSIACGLGARIIATYCHEPNVERYYVLGMVHDLGRLIFFMNLPDQVSRALEHCQARGELLYRMEGAAIGCGHAETGALLLRKWRLPERMQEAVCHHHHPSGARHYQLETSILHVADVIAHALKLGSSGDLLVPELDLKAWKRIGLPEGLLSSIINQMDHQFPDAIQMFLKEG